MSLTRDAIVEHLQQLLTPAQVITDEAELKRASVDNFRKLQNIFGVHTMLMPAAVVMVRSTDEVARVLAFADEHRVNVVARTGGTATEGGLESGVENSIVVDGSQMNRIISIDAYNMQATVECGVPLQALEDEVRKVGLTTGHSPQSKPIASMGGLTATRSIGQFSTLYGGIEDMVVGCEVVFPGGQVSRIKNVPRRAAGPDIRHIVIGNEGALCYITELTVKLFPYMPENHRFMGWTLKNMSTGFEALREVMVAGYKPSVARLYDFEDGQLHFSHFAAPDDCILLFMAEGNAGITAATEAGIHEHVEDHQVCAQRHQTHQQVLDALPHQRVITGAERPVTVQQEVVHPRHHERHDGGRDVVQATEPDQPEDQQVDHVARQADGEEPDELHPVRAGHPPEIGDAQEGERGTRARRCLVGRHGRRGYQRPCSGPGPSVTCLAGAGASAAYHQARPVTGPSAS
jgi:FAD/FMN-containing dehydrogenase